jgi:hypothetical protein
MAGALQMMLSITSGSSSGALDTTACFADDVVVGGTSTAYAEFNADGTIALVGNLGTSPASPLWWSTTPPSTWMSYSRAGTGTIVGGLSAGTRYELNTMRTLGIEKTNLGSVSSVFTITFYDAAVGGTTLGTKSLSVTAEYA